jgi:hypothetical protein
MNTSLLGCAVCAAAGFIAGISLSSHATSQSPAVDIAAKRFLVSIDEVKTNFVFAERFSGSYRTSVTMSDGSVRDIELLPVMKDGRPLVRFNDTGGHTFMGLNGTTTNGTLMVQLRDLDAIATDPLR